MDVRGRTRGATFAALAALGLLAAACGRQAADQAAEYRIFGQGSRTVQEVKLDAVETVQEIAPGVRYHVWTFGGTAPAPVIRVKQGDTVRFTLTNKSSLGLSHSIDFHAAQTPWNVNYVAVPPGESLTFEWVARFPGVFMYHCGVPPVLHHIANGMVGAIIVEPQDALPVAREYVLVSHEWYVGDAVKGVHEGDMKAMERARPSYVVFNGVANQYLDAPLVAKPDEPIRLWVVNAGPTLTTAFHVIGALFDHVYPDGNPTNQLNGVQTWNVPPGGAAMFELSIPDEGTYPFVTHAFAYTGLGAVGTIKISADAPDAPATYPPMASPFDGGLTEVKGTVSGAKPTPSPRASSSPVATTGTVTATEFAFTPSSLSVKRGSGIEFADDGALPHDFTIDELDVSTLINPGEKASIRLAGAAGTYTFYCSIPGHREAGMEGTVTLT